MGTDKEIIMLILSSHSHYTRLLEFFHESGTYKETSRDAIQLNGDKLKLNGVYDFLNKKLVVVYVSDGILFLRVANESIPVENITCFELNSKGVNSTLHVRYNNSTLSLDYKNSTDKMIEDDFTPFVEEEHFDFGLFVKNMISTRERRKAALSTWGNH